MQDLTPGLFFGSRYCFTADRMAMVAGHRMTSPDSAVHLVVNGEFYGYREIREQLRASGYQFATDSDSEIALHLYQQRGMQATHELRG